ncbi:MAG: hypothetical protein ACFHVJ_17575 [Aestuariibacter sp.]
MNKKITKERIKRWILKFLIKTKRVKSVAISADELNAMLANNLPEILGFPVPGSKGELELQSATISMPSDANELHVTLFCALRIDTVANPIYRAHIEILGTAIPSFDKPRRLIHLKEARLTDMRIIQDEYALLKDTKQIMGALLPEPIKSVFGVTMKTTLNLLSNGTYKDMRGYLSLYLHGSKQKILDYHRPELEKLVLHAIESGDLDYPLDESIFEEKIFAELGNDVKVRDGELHFVFNEEQGIK